MQAEANDSFNESGSDRLQDFPLRYIAGAEILWYTVWPILYGIKMMKITKISKIK